MIDETLHTYFPREFRWKVRLMKTILPNGTLYKKIRDLGNNSDWFHISIFWIPHWSSVQMLVSITIKKSIVMNYKDHDKDHLWNRNPRWWVWKDLKFQCCHTNTMEWKTYLQIMVVNGFKVKKIWGSCKGIEELCTLMIFRILHERCWQRELLRWFATINSNLDVNPKRLNSSTGIHKDKILVLKTNILFSKKKI